MLTTRLSVVTSTLCLTLVTLSATVQAGPLDLSRLPADTRWIIHFDLEGLAASRIGRALAERPSGGPMRLDEDSFWSELSREIEFDLASDLKSLTLLNAGDIPADTVVLVVAHEKVEKVFERMPDLLSSHRVATMNGHDIHSWTEVVDQRRDRWHANVQPGPKAEQRLVLLSQNWEQLLNVIERPKRPAALPEKLIAQPGLGSLIFGAASDLAESFHEKDVPWASGFAEAVRSLVFDLREHDGALTASVLLVTHEEEEATVLAQMLQGMVAMGRLTLANQPEAERAREILAKVAIVSEGDQIRIRLAVPIDVAVQSLNESGAFGELQLRRRSLDIGAGVRSKREREQKNRGDDAGE